MSESLDQYKREAALAAVAEVRPGMVVGLGHGSTAIHAIREIARLLDSGELHDIRGLPCSEHVAREARKKGMGVVNLGEVEGADLTIDGADELTETCDAVKGGGGALLSEKIVHQNSRRIILIVDYTKFVSRLGEKRALPVEVAKYGWQAQQRFIKSLGAMSADLRQDDSGEPFTTDHGHFILDCRFDPMDDPHALAQALESRAGIMEHGLFLNMAQEARVAGPEGLRTLRR
ncbi:ribose-5-phosphate isomerase RpiA [Oceanidesulfovibrio marinus]|uniref:Ribose-5-phosphate isomerase A n=1 Tax=Oceanidesulfovibrio marinus TaxID=370038 RepID=A0ABX6NJ92_9BACT|nr:ribose-5-phosphate isomerase RpiA [Oceanidesulfovibrio marinus]QJT10724.1 ribose-5-phosphate isomerase RpiA [Oceanidesulfovibrio marinus]